jgi:hypothetical protein
VALSLIYMLDDWRSDHSAALARDIDTRTGELLAGIAMPEPTDDRDYQRAWIVAAKDPVRRGWAAPRLCERLVGAEPGHRLGSLAKRIEVLAQCGPDPRTSHAVARVVAADPGVVQARRVYNAVVRALAESHDPRSDELIADVPTLGGLRHAITEYRRSPRMYKLMLRQGEYTEPVEPTPEIHALWRQVAANPSDLALRAVLGDALLANGDPRGELFALQLAAGGVRWERKLRITALLDRFGQAWLGRLTAIASRVVFRDGMVTGIVLRPTLAYAWHDVRDDPVLAAIEVVVPDRANSADYLQVISSPAMRSLRAVEVRNAEIARALPLLGAIQHVVFPYWIPIQLEAPHRALLRDDMMPACEACPSIRSLALHRTAFDALAMHPWLDHLTALAIAGPLHQGIEAWRMLPRTLELTLVTWPALEIASSRDDRIVLCRDGASVIARVLGNWAMQRIEHALEQVDDLARIEVAGGRQLLERIRGELGRRGVEVVAIEPPDVGYVIGVT